MTRYYEDFAVGETFSLPAYRVTRDEMRDFARQFDPQPAHLDPNSDTVPADDIIASGWHVTAIAMRLLNETVLRDMSVVAGRGVEELRWCRPVSPGDVLSGRAEIVSKSLDEADGRWGDIHMAVTLDNRNGETVLKQTIVCIVYCRGW